MKPTILNVKMYTLCLCLIFFVAFTACEKTELPDDNPTDLPSDSTQVEEPQLGVVPTIDFTLPDSCGWDVYAVPNDTVLIVNSLEELLPLLYCWDSDSLDEIEIDFEKYSLIVACGAGFNQIAYINTNLLRTSIIEYELQVDIWLDAFPSPEEFKIALLTSKLPEDANIKLIINQQPYNAGK